MPTTTSTISGLELRVTTGTAAAALGLFAETMALIAPARSRFPALFVQGDNVEDVKASQSWALYAAVEILATTPGATAIDLTKRLVALAEIKVSGAWRAMTLEDLAGNLAALPAVLRFISNATFGDLLRGARA